LNDREEFKNILLTEAIKSRGQFVEEGKEPQYRLDIWGIITIFEARTIIKLTSEALDVVDKVIDVIEKARQGRLIDIEITCPDGKTKMSLSAREKEAIEKLKQLKNMCK
jgi:hypothetical protein